MPNHVINILKVHGDENKVRTIFEAIKNDEIGLGILCKENLLKIYKFIQNYHSEFELR